MGIVNVTPDSFSDGGLYLDPERAIAHGRELVARRGGPPRRRRRVHPAGRRGGERRGGARARRAGGRRPSRRDGRSRSRSTPRRRAVAEAALDAGATIVNDVTALRGDPEIAGLVRRARRATVVLMHMQGSPRTMQDDPRYDDVVDDVKRLPRRADRGRVAAGIDEERIWVDPGIGFGKTARAQPRAAAPPAASCASSAARSWSAPRARASSAARPAREVGDRLGGTIASNVLALAAGRRRVPGPRRRRDAPGARRGRGDPRPARLAG